MGGHGCLRQHVMMTVFSYVKKKVHPSSHGKEMILVLRANKNFSGNRKELIKVLEADKETKSHIF